MIFCLVFLERPMEKSCSLETAKQVQTFSDRFWALKTILLRQACGLILFNFLGKNCYEGEFGQRQRICIYMRARASWETYRLVSTQDPHPTPTRTRIMWLQEWLTDQESKHIQHLKVAWCLTRFQSCVGVSLCVNPHWSTFSGWHTGHWCLWQAVLWYCVMWYYMVW